MTFEQFKYVLEVVKNGSVNQAANNLFLSQASLSISIKNLEEELGQAIFLRNNQGMQLTAFGRDFVSYITPICAQMVQLENMCRQKTGAGHLTFSVSSSGYRFVAHICARLYERYKTLGIHIYHFDGIGDETLDYVATRQVEIGVFRIWDCYKQLYMRQFLAKKLRFVSLAVVPMCVFVGKGSPLFGRESDYITADMLKQYPAVVDASIHNGPYSDIFKRLGIAENQNRIIAGSRAVIYDTLEHTDSFYLSSDSTIGYRKLNEATNLRSLKLDGCAINSEIGWLQHEDYVPTEIAKEFIRDITWIFQE